MFENLLNAYLDGTIGDADQAELFHILAVSNEKRQLFNDHARLRSIIDEDRIAGRVPDEVAQSTLHNALTQPAAEPLPASHAAVVAPAISKLVVGVALSCSIGLAGWIGFMIGKSFYTPATGNTAVIAQSTTAATQNTFDYRQKSGTEGSDATNATHATHERYLSHQSHESHEVHVSPVTESITAAPATAPTVNSSIASQEISNDQSVSKFSDHAIVPDIDNGAPMIAQQSPHYLPRPAAAEPVEYELPTDRSSDMNYEIDLAQGAHVFQNQINAATLPVLPTVSLFRLHVGARLGENIYGGAMAAQNTFALHYSDQPNAQTQRDYSQFTTQLYLGAYARYLMPSLIGLEPSVSLGAAVSALGPLANLELGVSHSLLGPMRVFAGFHGDLLMYSHSGVWYGCQTASFMVGLGTAF